MRRAARLMWLSFCWAAIGAGAALLVALTLPFAFDARPYTVLSGSMEPGIMTGDVVVVRAIKPTEARLGDVVTFRDPRHQSRLITHRVRSVQFDGREARFITRGDANTTTENWKLHQGGAIARVAYRIPKVGRVAFAAQDPVIRLFLIVMPALLLGIWALLGIWRPGGGRQDREVPELAG
jgi:signal peptidase I